jgi:hypothetical protein
MSAILWDLCSLCEEMLRSLTRAQHALDAHICGDTAGRAKIEQELRAVRQDATALASVLMDAEGHATALVRAGVRDTTT